MLITRQNLSLHVAVCSRLLKLLNICYLQRGIGHLSDMGGFCFMTDNIEKELKNRKYLCVHGSRDGWRERTHISVIYKKLFMEILMNVERLKDWDITKPKLVSGIQRSTFRIGFAAIQELLEAPPGCNTPCKMSYCICELMCIQRRGWVPSELLSFSDLLFRDFSWGMALYQQAAHQGERGNSHSTPSAPQFPPNLLAELFSPALLSCCGSLSLSLPLGFHIPAHPCAYLELHTQITILLFIWFYGTGLEWTAWEGANLTSGLLIFPPGLALGFQHTYTALMLEKNPDLAGIWWGGIGRQMSDCFGNIWKWQGIKKIK